MNNRVFKAQQAKEQISMLQVTIKAFFENLQNIKWDSLLITKEENGNSLCFTIGPPNSITNEFNLILDGIDWESNYKDIFHHFIWGHPENSYDQLEWNITISSIGNNRVHINGGGLPISFREIGLGKRIYKRVIREVGYISTKEDKSYTFSHLLWESLLRDEELFCFVSDDLIIATLKKYVPENMLLVLEKSFGHLDNVHFDYEFCKIYKDKVQGMSISKFFYS